MTPVPERLRHLELVAERHEAHLRRCDAEDRLRAVEDELASRRTDDAVTSTRTTLLVASVEELAQKVERLVVVADRISWTVRLVGIACTAAVAIAGVWVAVD